jgi:hypothetical protein
MPCLGDHGRHEFVIFYFGLGELPACTLTNKEPNHQRKD